MSLPLLSIQRHVLTAALCLAIVLAGLLAYGRLPLEQMPKINIPVLSVVTALPGADPETVAKSVTSPLESQLNTISGLDTLTSVSGNGVSMITLAFNAKKDMAEAMADVQSKLERAKRSLPQDAETPFALKFDLNAQPVVRLVLTSDKHSLLALSRAAETVQRRLESLPGVGEVQLAGTREETIRIRVDEDALAARGLTVSDVVSAFSRNHLQPAGGKADLPGRDYTVKLDFEAATPEQVGSIAVGLKDGVPIPLRDVAEVAFAESTEQQYAYFNGKQGVAVTVTKTDGANVVQVVDSVLALVPTLQENLPAGVALAVASEESKPIHNIVDALRDHLVEGTLFTALVIGLFLRNARATVIIATAIPVSLLGAVAAFQVLGYTLNSFTLLALLLLIGVVVDDAIVVLENIYRMQERHGLSAREAAEQGAKGVLFAVAASTLTLVSIFAPIMYLDGVLGQVFLPFAAIVTVGVLVSWLVAVTLTPMLCAKFLRHEEHRGRLASYLERLFARVETHYGATLKVALRYRKTVIAGALATVLPAGMLMGSIPKGFVPAQDTGRIEVSIELPAGAPARDIVPQLARVEAALRTVPEVVDVLTTYREADRNGTPSAAAAVTLSPERERTQEVILAEMSAALSSVDGVRATAGATNGGGGGGPPLQFHLSGPSQAAVSSAAQALLRTLRAEPVLSGLNYNLNLSSPQARVTLDRDAAARNGVAAQEAAVAIAAVTGQLTVGRYTAADGERRDVKLETAAGEQLEALDELLAARVKGAGGTLLPLSEIAELSVTGSASAITRVSQRYAVSFSATPNGAMGDAMAAIDTAKAALPDDLQITFAGQAEEFRKMGRSLVMVLAASGLLLYLVMASQFNSFLQPGILMLAQPLAAIGGIGALWLTGHSLNIYSMVGLVLLMGLTAKTGILLVDRANQLLPEKAGDMDAAVLEAAPERLRPIVMTALTVIASLAPAALGLGPGSENNGPLAVAVIGGMLSATVLTLYVIPAAYSLLGARHR